MNDTIVTPGTDNNAGEPPAIHCPGCGAARTIKSRRPSRIAEARQRMCRRCANPAKRPATPPPVICCPGCGAGRTIQSRRPRDIAAAGKRMCRKCSSDFAVSHRRPACDDLDEVTVDRLAAGQLRDARRASNRAERLAAVERLTRYGLPASLIAARMGVTKRTVERLRADIRNPRAVEAATNEAEAA